MTTPTNTTRLTPFPFAGTTILIDAWSPYPLEFGCAESLPAHTKYATTVNGQPPSMFSTGPLPPFTASNIDPQLLLTLPWQMRHAAAQEPNRVRVLDWLNSPMAKSPDAALPCEQLQYYVRGVELWLTNAPTPSPTELTTWSDERRAAMQEARDALLQQTIGAWAAHQQAKVDEVNAWAASTRPRGSY